MSRFLSRSSRLIETFKTIRDKSRFFEIFVGNQDFVEINRDFVEINWDFVEINQDFFSLDQDILDFRHLWKVVFKVLPWLFLAYLGLHSHPPQISTTKINISIEIYQKLSYFSIEIEKNIEKSRKITKVLTSLKKSWSQLKSMVLANLIETKSRTLNLDQDFSIVKTNFWKPSRLSITSRLILFWRRDRDRDHAETNQDPQP